MPANREVLLALWLAMVVAGAVSSHAAAQRSEEAGEIAVLRYFKIEKGAYHRERSAARPLPEVRRGWPQVRRLVTGLGAPAAVTPGHPCLKSGIRGRDAVTVLPKVRVTADVSPPHAAVILQGASHSRADC